MLCSACLCGLSLFLRRDGPSTVLESTVSNTKISELFALTECWGESSLSSFQPLICVLKRTHRVFFAELNEFGEELSEFFLPKQCSRSSIPAISQNREKRKWPENTPRFSKSAFPKENPHKMLSPRLCRVDLGRILYFGPANLRKNASEFLSEL